ncbi:hypothetical protein ACFWZT_17180 [Streptomyces alboflavus]|uniref:hypothetical protein n=1 Tax=Streptomyces alboflavus TaxID=67267 RepID=UPI0036D09B54
MTSLSLSAITGGVALAGVAAVVVTKGLKARKSVLDQARDQRKSQGEIRSRATR